MYLHFPYAHSLLFVCYRILLTDFHSSKQIHLHEFNVEISKCERDLQLQSDQEQDLCPVRLNYSPMGLTGHCVTLPYGQEQDLCPVRLNYSSMGLTGH
jgi:hypothetical protein